MQLGPTHRLVRPHLLNLQGIARVLGNIGIGQPTSTVWDVGPISLQQNSVTPFNVATTGPATYTLGGAYGIDGSGTQLPAGMSLSAAGSLSVGSAVPVVANGVVFSYVEPGGLPLISIYNIGATGTVPYQCGVMLMDGMVMPGETVTSPDDPTLRATILNSYPSGSPRMLVIAGSTAINSSATKNVQLVPSKIVTETALTLAYLDGLINTIDFANFGGGTVTLNDFSGSGPSYKKTWWANPAVICARYVTNIGGGTMQAAIDITAYPGNIAKVEVVIENAKFNPASPVAPTAQAYTSGSVSINGGAAIASVTTNGSYEVKSGATTPTTHEAYRAWYCEGWVGGSPNVEVTHDTTYMQNLPLFWKVAAVNNFDQSTQWGSYTYTINTFSPLLPGRAMAGTGEGGNRATWIGPINPPDSDYVETGSRFARRAVIATSLKLLTFTINYRDQSTGEVPTVGQLIGKRHGSTFPQASYDTSGNQYCWYESAHQPASPFVAFLCTGSPVFIDITHKAAGWNSMEGSTDGLRRFDQIRSRAWAYRNYGFSKLLTLDSETNRRTELDNLIGAAAAEVYNFKQPQNVLETTYDVAPNNFPYYSDSGNRPKGQVALWQHHWLLWVFHALDWSRVCTGTNATNVTTTADWLCREVIRFITDPLNGEWRLMNYFTTFCDQQPVSSGPTNIDPTASMRPTWGETLDADYIDTPPVNAGPWLFLSHDPTVNPNWNKWSSATPSNSLSDNYSGIGWACGIVPVIERGVPGAQAVWDRIVTNGGITNLSTFLAGGVNNPRYNRYPRNK